MAKTKNEIIEEQHGQIMELQADIEKLKAENKELSYRVFTLNQTIEFFTEMNKSQQEAERMRYGSLATFKRTCK